MKGRVYKLFCNDYLYVGSTFDRLCVRLCKHRDVGRKQRSNTKLYATMFEVGPNNFMIELLEEVDIETKEQLRLKEQEWIDKLNPNLNIIKSRPIVNDKELKRIEASSYYQKNRDKWIERWKCVNKEEYNEKRRVKKDCSICGKSLNSSYLSSHMRITHS